MIVDTWFKVSPKDGIPIDRLKAEMTIRNPEYIRAESQGLSTAGIPAFIRLYRDVGYQTWFPRGLANRYLDRDIEDRTSLGMHVDFKSKIRLWDGTDGKHEDQRPFADALEKALRNSYGACGMAETGFGKTVVVLEVLARLKRTALIIVHKEFLMNQWIDRIREFYDIDPSEIGIVQQDRCEYRGKKIVVAMMQSLLAREYPSDFYDYFGVVVWDEVHRLGASTFRETATMFPARYRIGVTATPKRKDDQEIVFFSHIGDIQAVGESRKIKPTIYMIRSNVVMTSDKHLRVRGRINFSKVNRWLGQHEARNRQIARLVVKAAESGRKIMVLSALRSGHLPVLRELIEAEAAKKGLRITIGYYVGGMSERELTISETRQVILATYQMAQEALDIPDLDTLVLATPMKDVEQAVGRILRAKEGKKNPIVLDIVDSMIGICRGMASSRIKLYKKKGWTIK